MSPAPLPFLLIIEPHFVLRRTIVAVAHELRIASFKEATGSDAARTLLASQRFDGIVVDCSGLAVPFNLLEQLREGSFASEADVAVVAMTSASTDGATIDRLLALESLSLLAKPFKLAALLHLLERMPFAAVA